MSGVRRVIVVWREWEGDAGTRRGLGMGLARGTVLFLQLSAGYMDMFTLQKSIKLYISD